MTYPSPCGTGRRSPAGNDDPPGQPLGEGKGSFPLRVSNGRERVLFRWYPVVVVKTVRGGNGQRHDQRQAPQMGATPSGATHNRRVASRARRRKNPYTLGGEQPRSFAWASVRDIRRGAELSALLPQPGGFEGYLLVVELAKVIPSSGRLDHKDRAGGLVRDGVRNAPEHAPFHALAADHEEVGFTLHRQLHQHIGGIAHVGAGGAVDSLPPQLILSSGENLSNSRRAAGGPLKLGGGTGARRIFESAEDDELGFEPPRQLHRHSDGLAGRRRTVSPYSNGGEHRGPTLHRARHRLLPQLGGFEGVTRFVKPGIPGNPAVAEGPQGRLSPLHFEATPSATCAVAQHHRHLIPHSLELLRLRLPGLPALEDFFNRSRERSATTSGSRFHRASGIDVLDLRVHKLDRPRELLSRPGVVEAPHDPHVLLRHRLLRQPCGFEGGSP